MVIILVSPQLGENIGAAARVMLNFGMRDLRIVNPRDGWPNPKAIDMAKGAKEVIENANIYTSLAEATHDITRLYATTVRPRDMVKRVVTPRKCIEEARGSGEKCAIMFGAERTGLTNDDIALADSICSIPVGGDYQSLNIAQAVAIMCYEWFIAEDITKNEVLDFGDSKPATKQEVNGLFEHLESELDKTDFFKLPDKKPKMSRNIRNMLVRANLTDQDVRTLRGVLRSLTERYTPCN